MIFQRFFAPKPEVLAGRALFASANAQARNPTLYGDGAVPDTYEGRFELLALHVVLLLHRLKGNDVGVAETRQGLFDAFVRNLDDGLREMGVGDLSVGKKMRKLGAAVYGRLKSYDEALSDGGQGETLAPLLARTVFADRQSASAAGEAVASLVAYIIAANALQAATPTDYFLQGQAPWPPLPA